MTTQPSAAEGPLLITCVGVEHDLALLAHFLAHYRALGVRPERMRPILNARSAEAPELAGARALLAAHGVAAAEEWIAPYTSDSMWAKRREVQAREAAPEDWVISADVDELHEYPEPLDAFLARCARERVDCVQGVFIDRLAIDGRLAPVLPEPSIWEQFPLEAEVALSIAGQGEHHGRHGTLKLMALRGRVPPSRGGHHPLHGAGSVRFHLGAPLASFPGVERADWRFALPLRVHHFHWTAGLDERLRRRLATPGASVAGKEYGGKQLDHIEAHGGIALDRVARPGAAPRLPWRARVTLLRAEARLRRLGARGREAASAALARVRP
jgi:hypothetical protein